VNCAEGALRASALPVMREICKRRLCEDAAACWILQDETATLLILLRSQIASKRQGRDLDGPLCLNGGRILSALCAAPGCALRRKKHHSDIELLASSKQHSTML
jgi:hypothetical protein